MKNKIFLAVMVIVLTITLLAACGKKEGDQDNGAEAIPQPLLKNYPQKTVFRQAELLKAALQ